MLPSRFADGSENSGAREPISKVSVRFCISIDSRLVARAEQAGKQPLRTSGVTHALHGSMILAKPAMAIRHRLFLSQ